MKTFVHTPTQFADLTTEMKNGKRWYKLPSGQLVPSVTSVLDTFKSAELKRWQDRVGCATAEKIKQQATARGTAMHDLLETYIKNEPLPNVLPHIKQAFIDLKPTLERIDNVVCQESCLYSEKIKVAGRNDVIADFDRVRSIVDFKTASKPKKIEWIINYFEQVSAYKELYLEMTGDSLQQAVIIISVDQDPEPQIFKLNAAEMRQHYVRFKDKLDTFWSQHAGES